MRSSLLIILACADNMKLKIPVIILFLMHMLSCQEEPGSKHNSLVGEWNSYESGTNQLGFTKQITNALLASYESGVSFYADGTFGPRYFVRESGSRHIIAIEESGTWSSGSVSGNYELKDNTITLTFSPGTPDESKRYLHLVKLDERHLWFRHSFFGEEIEYHLVRYH